MTARIHQISCREAIQTTTGSRKQKAAKLESRERIARTVTLDLIQSPVTLSRETKDATTETQDKESRKRRSDQSVWSCSPFYPTFFSCIFYMRFRSSSSFFWAQFLQDRRYKRRQGKRLSVAVAGPSLILLLPTQGVDWCA